MRIIIAEIRCFCGKWVNIRMKEINKGDAHEVSCWNCTRRIRLQNGIGYCDGKRTAYQIVLNEVVKND